MIGCVKEESVRIEKEENGGHPYSERKGRR